MASTAGTARTSNFLVTAGTLMIGAQASVWDLNPASHSVGLVKNIAVMSDPTFLNLTQGVKNQLIYSLMTKNDAKITAEVYEYTAKNLTYGLSLDGTATAAQTFTTTTSAIIDGSPTPTTSVTVTSATGIAGDGTAYIMIDASGGTADDDVIVRRVASKTGSVLTVSQAISRDVASGAAVTVVNAIDIGSTTEGPFLSAKIAGKLPNGTPVAFLFPKIRITKGFNVSFNTEQFQNMPFEIEVLDLLSTDTFYADFKGKKASMFIP